tara:strand:+ start:4598 stop:6235 length:1638 start_codon:yes stop_codon:yes gene_type:complete
MGYKQRQAPEIQAVLKQYRELGKKVARRPSTEAVPKNLQDDYAYVLRHAGSLDFVEIGTHMVVEGFEFPELEIATGPELPELGAFFYRIGTSYSGDELIQFALGRHRGALAVVDHELLDWDDVSESHSFAQLKNAVAIGALGVDHFDELVDELDDAISISHHSLEQVLRAAFESYQTSFANYAAVRPISDRIYEPFVRVLVNSINNRRGVGSFALMALEQVEATVVLEVYECQIEPNLDLLGLHPTVLRELTVQTYWLQAVCYLIDAYLVCGRLEKVEPYLVGLQGLFDARDEIGLSRPEALSLRLACIYCQLGRVSDALTALHATVLSQEAKEFKAVVKQHTAFTRLRGEEMLTEFLEREEELGVYTGWAFHGSKTLKDLCDFPSFLAENYPYLLGAPEQPAAVPPEASWNPDEHEWFLGRKNERGKLDGLVKYWRPDGSLLCDATLDEGNFHGPYTGFHESGEVSRDGQFFEGQFDGLNCYYRTKSETTEVFPCGLGEPVSRVEFEFKKGAMISTRIFDAKGNRYTEEGELIPAASPVTNGGD